MDLSLRQLNKLEEVSRYDLIREYWMEKYQLKLSKGIFSRVRNLYCKGVINFKYQIWLLFYQSTKKIKISGQENENEK